MLGQTKQARGLIRSLNRAMVRDDKSPRVVEKTAPPHDPTICARCGAVFLRKTWRNDHKLSDEQLERGEWGFCPACLQVSKEEGQGRLLMRGKAVSRDQAAIRRRIRNVAARAAKTQPQRRIVSIESTDGGLDVLTTSQKLAHRLGHELKKLFGGRVTYTWNDDGTLFATWDYQAPKGAAHRNQARTFRTRSGARA
jgi:NMD protein affecting ribosome stability and mRNA decay